MECANLVPDDYAYSAAIIACGRAGDPNAALLLFSEMEDRAAAAARSAVRELYNENEDDDTVSATASDDLLFATSSGADAAAVTDNVKSKRMKKKEWTPRAPNPHCYRAALSVCQVCDSAVCSFCSATAGVEQGAATVYFFYVCVCN